MGTVCHLRANRRAGWKCISERLVALSAPGVLTAAILAFVNACEFAFPWPLISAALIVAIVPISILIAVFRERVVGGLTAGCVKGLMRARGLEWILTF